ncbi:MULTISPECIES: extracellular solute-binding protein [Mesorhizobium]|uniref:extracellular solute-binding protein n=1 Tax=Mesorhizobium TaxID=68287 RepID=UPI000A8BE006|nr:MULTISPECIES: extracellular solute-binding protein [Mesorhizobium]MDG4879665.1 extracellular solute-binding protein [Mesorhizobium sp. WSM4935]MDG4904754.1 extracellular solute-binding protein [Mesorhizobium sp. WSM4962]WIE92626.1 extracellular solute-binding protein [Mesorhizobium sp. WSM4875]MCF6127949.1 extracellular solute-binding protein [Mesorhizobium ciceri]MCQ8818422.1 extracellular solute-binding protein [Mesorhizobium sp. SEMIA396]
MDMIKKCAAPSFASGRSAMTIDSNMFGFWNDVAGKPASGKIAFAPPLHAPSATSLESDIWIWALAMNAASEKKGTAWLFIPWATSKQVALKGALAGQLVNPPRTSTWQTTPGLSTLRSPSSTTSLTASKRYRTKPRWLSHRVSASAKP